MQVDCFFNPSLLDVLSSKACCDYLSDLRNLCGREQLRLAQELEKLPPGSASLSDWNDALNYLLNEPPQPTREAAREQLLRGLHRRAASAI